ncbi:hypothetical protein BGAL_0021g00240 [Botrytis galanthina]|uniref:Uncharacterized protein n=1 Tax=Botrytis galanthina TaxID=278940 RepID=A0A4S8RBH1_9HELO|nr:hypothetical protein BGAL_0021g00240 [Botrytis galanthina]
MTVAHRQHVWQIQNPQQHGTFGKCLAPTSLRPITSPVAFSWAKTKTYVIWIWGTKSPQLLKKIVKVACEHSRQEEDGSCRNHTVDSSSETSLKAQAFTCSTLSDF